MMSQYKLIFLLNLKVHCLIFLVIYFQNSCCPFTSVRFFMNTYHHHQILSLKKRGDLLHVCHFEFPEIDIFSYKTYFTLVILAYVSLLFSKYL